MPANTRVYRGVSDVSGAPNDYILAAKSDDTADPNGPFRGFIMDAAGAVKLTTGDGVDRTYTSGTFSPGVSYGFATGITRFWSSGSGGQSIYGIV